LWLSAAGAKARAQAEWGQPCDIASQSRHAVVGLRQRASSPSREVFSQLQKSEAHDQFWKLEIGFLADLFFFALAKS